MKALRVLAGVKCNMEMEELITALTKQIYAVYIGLLAPYVEKMLEEEFREGGKTYERLMGGALSSAAGVYGAYHPTRYVRRGSLTERDNIKIAYSMKVKGSKIFVAWSVANIAEGVEDGLLEPLIMGGWRRPPGYFGDGPKGWWRIAGRNLYALVPNKLTFSLPKGVANDCFKQAIDSVLSL